MKPDKKTLHAAAAHKTAAEVATQDPDAPPDDHDAHALHGAKLLSAIASAHVNRLQEAASKKRAAKPGKGTDSDEPTEGLLAGGK